MWNDHDTNEENDENEENEDIMKEEKEGSIISSSDEGNSRNYSRDFDHFLHCTFRRGMKEVGILKSKIPKQGMYEKIRIKTNKQT